VRCPRVSPTSGGPRRGRASVTTGSPAWVSQFRRRDARTAPGQLHTDRQRVAARLARHRRGDRTAAGDRYAGPVRLPGRLPRPRQRSERRQQRQPARPRADRRWQRRRPEPGVHRGRHRVHRHPAVPDRGRDDRRDGERTARPVDHPRPGWRHTGRGGQRRHRPTRAADARRDLGDRRAGHRRRRDHHRELHRHADPDRGRERRDAERADDSAGVLVFDPTQTSFTYEVPVALATPTTP